MVREELQPLTPEQTTRLLAVAIGSDYEHLYILLLASGLRLGEALGLRWQDIAVTQRYAHVLTLALTESMARLEGVFPGTQWAV